MILFAGVFVKAFGLFLIGLAILIIVKPQMASRFLNSFASSARAHYTEQALRLFVGSAIVFYSPWMRYPNIFGIFGWLIVLTAVGLLFVPWRWHQRFGQWAIPLLIRHLTLYAAGAFILGTFILYGTSPWRLF